MVDMTTLGKVHEIRDIKLTTKRQMTIPKKFYDHLGIKNKVRAYLFNDAIVITTEKEKTVQQEDYEKILKNAIKEGYTGTELAKEFAKRIKEYDKVIKERIEEFTKDLNDDTDIDEGDDFNGLEIFFDEKARENIEES